MCGPIPWRSSILVGEGGCEDLGTSRCLELKMARISKTSRLRSLTSIVVAEKSRRSVPTVEEKYNLVYYKRGKLYKDYTERGYHLQITET